MENSSLSPNEEKVVSLRSGVLVIGCAVVLIFGGLYLVGSKFFWNQYDNTPVAKQQEKILTEFQKENPDRIEAILAMGDLYLKEGQYDKAWTQFKKAEAKDNKNITVKFRLGFTAVQAQKYAEGIKYLEEYQKKDKLNFISRVNLGVAYRETGQYDKAMSEFEFANKVNPGAADLLLEMAKVDVAKQDKVKALERINKALAYVPDYAEALALKQKITGSKTNK